MDVDGGSKASGPGVATSARLYGGSATGRTAAAVGVAGLASAVGLGLFFAGAGPFGVVNDVGNAVVGVLGGMLAWLSRARGTAHPAGARPGLAALAVLGGLVTVAGSVLVVSGVTGFLLAGSVSSVGFALVGLWSAAHNRSLAGAGWPAGLTRLGTVAGVIMAIGLVNVAAIATGLDDAATAPAWVWVGGVGWLGTYLLFPVWCLWYGRVRRPGA